MLTRLFATFLIAVSVTPLTAQPDFPTEYTILRTNPDNLDDSTRMHRLFELDFEYGMATYPEWATWEGRYERNGEWTDNSESARRQRDREAEWSYEVIKTINRAKLPEAERLNYDLYRKRLERGLESRESPDEYMPISQLGGIHQSPPRLFRVMPKRNVKDYEDILSRMRGLPYVIRNVMHRMEVGRVMGITPPKVTLRDVPDQVRAIVPDDPTESPLYEPFRTMPESIAESEQKRLREEYVALYRDSVAAIYGDLATFLDRVYIPDCRESIGYSALPEGERWYAFVVEGYTTTTMSPDEIFEVGQREVARIRKEMRDIVAASDFDGTLEEYEEFLRTDPQFFHKTAEELLTGYRDICKKADPELSKLFGYLPRMPYGVIPIPDYMAKSQTTAYYSSGSIETGRPGYFYANTWDLASRPTWEMEPLALHEAVPGHHLQISIAQELKNLPRWRRGGGYTAYVEGWGLYAESLGEEMGFYTETDTKYGQLSYEMWRAVRLVVDVGIHHKGWSRQQAIDFFRANSGKSQHDIEVEIDRYIVWPGQALAYKIGELKITELRRTATERLGDAFDIRAFHDAILGDGPLPLDVLERKMGEWVEEQGG